MKDFKETKAELLSKIKLGKWHDIGFALCNSGNVDHHRLLQILVVDNKDVYTASLFCRNEKGVGYFWIAPVFCTQFSERILCIQCVS